MGREHMLWAEKRVVVTGGAGFLGTYVVRGLRARGCRVVVVPRSQNYDLRQPEAVARLYAKVRPHITIHLAAVVGGIGANQAYPGRFLYDNAVMGLHVVEYARRFDVEKLVVVGTVCAYPKFTQVPFREEDLWNGYPEETNAPYGVAKRLLLAQTQAYRTQYGLKAIYLLPTNVYGSGDNFDRETSHVIPAIIRKCVEAKERRRGEVVLWGDGTPTREFLYVEDAAEGIVLAAEQYDDDSPLNLGTGQEIAISTLAELVAAEVGYAGDIRWDCSKPNGQPRRCLDVTHMRRSLRFEPRWGLRAGIAQTVAWYLASRHSCKTGL